jgi:hypothetical protein
MHEEKARNEMMRKYAHCDQKKRRHFLNPK